MWWVIVIIIIIILVASFGWWAIVGLIAAIVAIAIYVTWNKDKGVPTHKQQEARNEFGNYQYSDAGNWSGDSKKRAENDEWNRLDELYDEHFSPGFDPF